jgi:hypothetical protein
MKHTLTVVIDHLYCRFPLRSMIATTLFGSCLTVPNLVAITPAAHLQEIGLLCQDESCIHLSSIYS